MVGKQQMGLAISEDQRRPWVELITRTADEIGLPENPELRSAFVAYLEWGTRLARANSARAPILRRRPRCGGRGEAPPYAG